MEKSKEIDLERVKVEQVTDYFDLADIETALSRHHPLGHKKAMGRRIYYAASYRGTLILFSSIFFLHPLLRDLYKGLPLFLHPLLRDLYKGLPLFMLFKTYDFQSFFGYLA